MGSRVGRRTLILLAWLLLPGSFTYAHQGGVTGYAAIELRGNVLRHRLTLSQLPPTLLAAAGGDPQVALTMARDGLAQGLRVHNAGEDCATAGARAEAFVPGKESVVLEVDVVCRVPLTQLELEDRSFEVLGKDLHTLARITWQGGETQFAFAPETPRLALVVAAAGDAAAGDAAANPEAQGLASFLRLGFFHILAGYDHLMFLLALLLVPAGPWAVVRIVTAFTLAHSVTLALTALGWLNLPARWVETSIALSIAFVAVQNLRWPRPTGHRALVTALFGLVHGCGFADLLRQTGLPAGGQVEALLGFNLGVEAGQLLVVLGLLPVLHWLSRRRDGPRVRSRVSLALCVAGLALAALRLAS